MVNYDKYRRLIAAEDLEEGAWIVPDDIDDADDRIDDDQSDATDDEIAQAKEDSICPRCNRLIYIDPEGVYCNNCGFSF